MIKSTDSNYVPGRRVGGWVKLKPIQETLDLVITGAEWGEGKRANWLSSLTISCKEGDEFLEIGKVGTGIREKENEEGLSFSQITKELEPLIISKKGKEVKLEPKLILEIAYEEIQNSNNYNSKYALRFPRVLKIRNDLSLNDVDDLERVEKIYKKQRKI